MCKINRQKTLIEKNVIKHSLILILYAGSNCAIKLRANTQLNLFSENAGQEP